MRETKNLEFKENISNTFLKTVSAFANYEGGKILFGVDDNGNMIGLENPKKACLDIENKVNDTIRPQPSYELTIDNASNIVILEVKPGRHKPYTYKSKAYKRNDSATIEVDPLELSRLILDGNHLHYEDLPADNQNLQFEILGKMIEEHIGIENFNMDILKTLELYSDKNGYNKAAEILADTNEYPGIDVSRFGDSISIILQRTTLEHQSILKDFKQAMEIYRNNYQYEEIDGEERTVKEKIPESAYREAVANALIHRTWDVKTQIRILMFEDRIEITSPGGLPEGISEEEYVNGTVSVLRNPIIGHVFYRLHIVEILGTGVRRIMEAYEKNNQKPIFKVFDHSIQVILPVLSLTNLTKDEQTVYNILNKNIAQSISEITSSVPFGRSKVTTLLKRLADKNYVEIIGNGRGTKYLKR